MNLDFIKSSIIIQRNSVWDHLAFLADLIKTHAAIGFNVTKDQIFENIELNSRAINNCILTSKFESDQAFGVKQKLDSLVTELFKAEKQYDLEDITANAHGILYSPSSVLNHFYGPDGKLSCAKEIQLIYLLTIATDRDRKTWNNLEVLAAESVFGCNYQLGPKYEELTEVFTVETMRTIAALAQKIRKDYADI